MTVTSSSLPEKWGMIQIFYGPPRLTDLVIRRRGVGRQNYNNIHFSRKGEPYA